MRITILGCGAAPGVPAIGPSWGNCDPKEPRNRRRRVSILIDDDQPEGPVLVDTSPDLREQLLDAEVGRLGAVLYTHAHADHLHGIDDLRSVNRILMAAIPAYATAETWASIGKRFGYVLEPPSTYNGKIFFYRPSLTAHTITSGETFEAAGVTVTAFEQDHGFGNKSTGFRFGAAAYSTDVFELQEDAFAVLAGIKLWIVDCLSRSPIPNHAHLAKVLEWRERLRPERTVLTHMGTELDYQRLKSELPSGVEPAYDGMVLEV